MELFRTIDIELVGSCLAGLVLLQLVFEVRRHRRASTEPPPRIVCLDGELGGLWSGSPGSNDDDVVSEGEVARGE